MRLTLKGWHEDLKLLNAQLLGILRAERPNPTLSIPKLETVP